MTNGHVTPVGTSVLHEPNLDPTFIVKAQMAIRITISIAEMGLTQREAAARMPISPPKLSLITRGKLDDISQAKLEECLQALGHDIKIRIGARHEGVGKLKILEVV